MHRSRHPQRKQKPTKDISYFFRSWGPCDHVSSIIALQWEPLDGWLACDYWPSSLEAAGCPLQKELLSGIQKTATALKDPPWSTFTTSPAPALHLPTVGTVTPSPVTLLPSRTTSPGGPSRERPSSARRSWEPARLLPSLKQRHGHCLQAGGWRWTEGQGEWSPVATRAFCWPQGMRHDQSRRCPYAAAVPQRPLNWFISISIQIQFNKLLNLLCKLWGNSRNLIISGWEI